jgi:hypothetical protein
MTTDAVAERPDEILWEEIPATVTSADFGRVYRALSQLPLADFFPSPTHSIDGLVKRLELLADFQYGYMRKREKRLQRCIRKRDAKVRRIRKKLRAERELNSLLIDGQ